MKAISKSARLVAVLGVSALAFGCAPKHYPLNAFQEYDYWTAVNGYRATVKKTKEKDQKNIVLADVHYAAASFVGGDYRDALSGLSAASQIMEDVQYGSGRGAASMALSHDLRVYKGEPYERAMAYTYLGLIYYRAGDFQNARSAFNLALLADRGSKGSNEDYRDDFGVAHYMIGKTYLKLGEPDNAEISFNKVRKYMPDNPFADPAKVKDTNFTLLVEMGCGPFKVPDPVVGSVDTIHTCAYPERSAEVYLDGQSLGRTAKVVDVNYQAKTSGSSARDVAQAAKGVAVAVVKQIPIVGLLGSVAEAAGVNKADLRSWRLMPGEIQVLEANVPVGLHTLQIKFFDQAGKELERYQQVHYFLRTGDAVSPEISSEPIFIVRSGSDRHNEVRAKPQGCSAWSDSFESPFGPDFGLPCAR